MARPKCTRFIGDLPDTTFFKPRGVPLADLQEVVLTNDEYEALRLADLYGLYHEEAAARMDVSRATFGRILSSAHRNIADALINGKAISIKGGVVKVAQKRTFQCSDCEHSWEVPFGTGRPGQCPQCGGTNLCRADGGRGRGRGGAGCRRGRGRAKTSGKGNQ